MKRVLLICLFLWHTAAFAAETAKVITEDAPTVAKSNIELELSYAYETAEKSFNSSNHTNNRRSNRVNTLSGKITYGIAKNLDSSIAWGWADIKDNDLSPNTGRDVSDLIANVKYNFFKDSSDKHFLSYLPAITVPTGGESSDTKLGPGQDFWNFNQMLAYTYNSKQLTFSSNLGYSLPIGNDRANNRGGLSANFAAGYQVSDSLQPIIEVNFSDEFIKDDINPYFFALTTGLIWNITNSFRMDLGVSQVVYGRSIDRSTVGTINLSYTI